MFDAMLNLRTPMAPLSTDVVERLQILTSIRAVVFDVYGTLVVSGSGDVGSADSGGLDERISEAMSASGLLTKPEQIASVADLHAVIRKLNDARQNENCPKPEVDIVAAWRLLLSDRGIQIPDNAAQRVVQLAVEYEARANPTWPMPQASELLHQLQVAGLPMGIVSNAQVFTLSLVKDLLVDGDLSAGGFDLDLCVFSNRFRQAKPGPRLFDVLREGLARSGILPHEAIYVGNDMLNDIWAASQAGLRTAWFAGDARSCRPRSDDPRCRSLTPDLILTSLMQLPSCLGLK